jgi:ribosomal protein L7/L12
MYDKMGKPDTFVLIVAALSEKLVQKENELGELRTHIASDHEKMDDMQYNLTDLRRECDSLREENSTYRDRQYRLENQVYDLQNKIHTQDYITAENARMREELLQLKYGNGTAEERARTYMEKEGARQWQAGNKILCIKGVRECTGWGLKEAKDYSEANGPTVEPAPKTQPSEDLKRQTG